MKKNLIFALAMSGFLLASCGGGNNPSSSEGNSSNDEGSVSSAESQADYSSVDPISYSEYSVSSASQEEGDHNDEAYDYGDLKVNPVDNLVDDFAFGADLSAVAEVEANGGVYYDKDGNPADVFQILADGGVNYCRLRLWNDPYSDTVKDADGNRLPYGGGTNDLSTDIYLAKRAKAAGMKILLDFHYSDSWADPAKFYSPKAWKNEMADTIPEVLGNYTAGTLRAFEQAGVEIDSVQIGNEENTGLAGYSFSGAKDTIALMVKAGVLAAKSVFPNIKTLIHLTNIKTKKSCQNFLAAMAEYEVPYDVVGLSYYPFWHGEKSNLTWMMEYIKDTYNKPSWVVETSYGFTDEPTEWASNQYGSHLENAGGYLTSYQGQTTAVRDIIEVIADAKDNCGQGCFYWEPAWLPVRGSTWATAVGQYYNAHGRDPYNFKASSSYKKGTVIAHDGELYTAKEEIAAGAWDESKWEIAYNETSCRSAWANQGWFSYTGKVLPSAYTYKLLQDGSQSAEEHILGIRETEIEVNVNLSQGINLPTSALIYSDFDALRSAPVTWDADEVALIVDDGTYYVHGSVTSGTDTYELVAKVIAQSNWVSDFSFEEQAEGEQVDVREPWEVTTQVPGAARIEAKSEGNLDGDKYFHWYCASENTWELSQTITGITPGVYDLGTRIMAGDMKSDYKVFNIWYELNGGTRVTKSIIDNVMGYGSPLSRYMIHVGIDEIELTEASNTLKIGLYCEHSAQAWGHNDVWSFSKHVESEVDPNIIKDGGFEGQSGSSLVSPWVLDDNTGEAFCVVANSGGDAIGGDSVSLNEAHWWSSNAFSWAFHQDIESVEAGTYTLTFLTKTDVPTNFDKFDLYYKVGSNEEVVVDLLSKLNPSGWAEDPTLVTVEDIVVEEDSSFTIGFRMEGKAGSWGHFTDLLLMK